MKTVTCEFSVEGMHCDTCELFMEETVKKQHGVIKAQATSEDRKVKVTLKEGVDIDALKETLNKEISQEGYRIVETLTHHKLDSKKLIISGVLAGTIFALYLLLQKYNLTSLFEPEKLTYGYIFLLGILASLSTCMAIVGGISMTLSTKFATEQKTKSIITFHVARIVGFIILGAVIGFLGRVILINSTISALIRYVVAFVMFGVGIELLGFRLPKVVLPKQISRAFGFFNDRDGWSSAVLLGVGTFFLPCAFTQSMQLYAMSTGSLIQGALVMGTFALGTLPVLGAVSFGAMKGALSLNKSIFGYTMGYLIALFALLNIVNSVVLF